MKIGIDLDGVVFNTEMLWSTYAELYDCIELNRNSVITKEEPRFQERYDWTEENKEAFLDKYADITEFDMMPGAKQVISMLKEEGHELVVITARGAISNQTEGASIAAQKLEDEGIKFDKYYWKQREKIDICQMENIDVMIDDNYHICEAIRDVGIPVIYFNSLSRKHLEERDGLKEVYNWGEAYRVIKNLK
ncbi:MAG: hypothetical protein IJ890_09570 [Clostridia bacterium]|nr:hypothetical protein [Clostridia bacterium]